MHSPQMLGYFVAAGFGLFILLVFLSVIFLRYSKAMTPAQMRHDRRALLLAALIALVFLLAAALSIVGENIGLNMR